MIKITEGNLSTKRGRIPESYLPCFDVVKLINEKKKLAIFNKDTIVRKGNKKMLKDKSWNFKKMTWGLPHFFKNKLKFE